MQKILIIEDDPSLSEALAKKMKGEGFESFVSSDGETGFRMIEEKLPDLILLDLILPKKNGFQILEDLAKRPDLGDIPVVVLSNLESAYDIERVSSFGVKGYLVKANYSLDEVVKKVRAILAS